jgi:hypothetical protein
MSKRDRFIEVLKKWGVKKCYVTPGFDFEAERPDGDIRVDVNNMDLFTEIYSVFTPNGWINEEQALLVCMFISGESFEPNFIF